MKNEREQKGGKQKEQFKYFHLQNDEFDPYAIVVLNQLCLCVWIGKRRKENEDKMK